jgi:hypothetical protein
VAAAASLPTLPAVGSGNVQVASVTVQANLYPGTPIPLDVGRYEIRATGSWSVGGGYVGGPFGAGSLSTESCALVPTAPMAALVGTIGSDIWFRVGGGPHIIDVPAPATLQLTANDCPPAGNFGDNSGSLDVTVVSVPAETRCFDGSTFSGWNFPLGTPSVNVNAGNPAPALQTTSGQRAWQEFAGLGSGWEITADMLLLGGGPLNLAFLSDTLGAGQFFRLDSRPGSGATEGFASMSSWTSWRPPGASYPGLINGRWYAVRVVIGDTSATGYIDNTLTDTYTYDNKGAVIALHGDSAGGGQFDNVCVRPAVADVDPPTVTINQAPDQADPTNATPITFTVTFSEAVTGFTAEDVVLGGTAGADAVNLAGSGKNYTIAVSGMTRVGTVTAAVAADAAVDAAGNSSVASTSTDNAVLYVPGDPNPGVNDAPSVVAPETIEAELGVALALTDDRVVAVVDHDAFDDPIAVTLRARATTFTVPATEGVTLTENDDGVTLTGPQAGINSALAGLLVTFSATGSIPITVHADDQGHSPLPAQTSTATITATVTDSTPPVIMVPSVTVVAANDPGRPGATVEYQVIVSDPGRPDVAGRFPFALASARLDCAPASGAFFPLGTTSVACTATDAAANTSSASFAVRVDDTERPVISMPATMQVTLRAGDTSGGVSYPTPTATDNSGEVSVMCSPASGSTFPEGITTVTCTATDPSGNTDTGTFDVQVASATSLPVTGGNARHVVLALTMLLAGLTMVAIGQCRYWRRLN